MKLELDSCQLRAGVGPSIELIRGFTINIDWVSLTALIRVDLPHIVCVAASHFRLAQELFRPR